MGLSIWQILIVALLVVLLFGRGRISDLMGDLGKGITSFRKGLSDAAAEPTADPKTIDNETGEPLEADTSKEKSNT